MGEIRDEESVDALMRLSSSGHRAISTLHTNSVCEVPNRFFLFRVQPFMVADSLKNRNFSALGEKSLSALLYRRTGSIRGTPYPIRNSPKVPWRLHRSVAVPSFSRQLLMLHPLIGGRFPPFAS
jgi:hypothetical protein